MAQHNARKAQEPYFNWFSELHYSTSLESSDNVTRFQERPDVARHCNWSKSTPIEETRKLVNCSAMSRMLTKSSASLVEVRMISGDSNRISAIGSLESADDQPKKKDTASCAGTRAVSCPATCAIGICYPGPRCLRRRSQCSLKKACYFSNLPTTELIYPHISSIYFTKNLRAHPTSRKMLLSVE